MLGDGHVFVKVFNALFGNFEKLLFFFFIHIGEQNFGRIRNLGFVEFAFLNQFQIFELFFLMFVNQIGIGLSGRKGMVFYLVVAGFGFIGFAFSICFSRILSSILRCAQ